MSAGDATCGSSAEAAALDLREIVGRARATIRHLRAADRHFAAVPDAMWSENVAAFRYLLDGEDLSPFEALRLHTHHITGDPGRKLPRVAERRGTWRGRAIELAHRLGLIDSRRERALQFGRWLRSVRPSGTLQDAVAEPAALGGDRIASSVIDGRRFNFESARFLVILQNIAEWGVLPPWGRGAVVLDLGGGWGGLAHALKTAWPECRVVIVDLPETLIYSMTYLPLRDPSRTVYAPAASHGLGDPSAIADHDYSFFSPGILERLPARSVDLVVNTGSMAEMSEVQVAHYAREIKRVGRGAFFSLNEDRQARNRELHSLRVLLAREFRVRDARHTVLPFHALACTWEAA